MQQIAKAVAGKAALPFVVRLKDSRKVTVEHGCGGALVCIDKCGPDSQLGPRMRVRLSQGDWKVLVGAFPKIQAAIAAQLARAPAN